MRTVWIVAFIARERLFWWDWLYRGPWRHVVAYRYDVRTENWLAIDWNQHELTVVVLRRDEVAGLWTQQEADGGVLIRWEGPEAPTTRVCWPAYCVPVLAHAIGLRRRVATPRAFLSALRAAGGTDFLIRGTAPDLEHSNVAVDGGQGPEAGS